MQIDLHLIRAEPEDAGARGTVDAVHVEQDHETALRLREARDVLAEPAAELGLLCVPERIAVLARPERLVRRSVRRNERARAAQAIETCVAGHGEQPFLRTLDAFAVLPIPQERLLTHVFGLVAIAEQQLRDTVDDAAVSQDRELEPKARYAAVLGFPIGFGRRAFADLQSGHHAVPIEPPTLIRTRPTPEG